ncbi:glycoside hydrolase family 78 protein [Paenibacillus alginolyticus]|uniref:family 78 glycoside hydrolase catalytic domain n=1 Tax=Paenibacillus alginolyticus TaxID=59839 RepID=UPI0003FB5BBA|nr:family 78 glycoside hydrolase catalytic domain [Paenibacillus alginolyticus]MCY9668873.1 glycoside hydrolase family 78 protein [Paenibacillus alginolyticus]
MFKIKDLRCEYQVNPIGLEQKTPRISWRLQSSERAAMQSAYRIEVAEDADFQRSVWDTGKVDSDQSVHVELKGLQTASRKRYHYRVQAWNQHGLSSGWSDQAIFETGFIDSSEWSAEWISAPAAALPAGADQVPMFRRDFLIDGEVSAARVYASALGIYELELNGKRVGDHYFAPGWTSYKHRLQYQTYDVTELLRSGKNGIGALLGSGWYKGVLGWDGKNEHFGNRTALLVQIHIDYADGRQEVIVSDNRWKVSGSPILMSEIYDGETYDARLERSNWSHGDYDDGGWHPVDVIEQSKDVLVAQENVPVRKIESIQPIELITTPKGETVIDMGQNMVGWIQFTVQGDAGQEVSIHHAEILDHEGNFYLDNIRKAKQTIRYVLKGGERETFEPHFTFQGFRYIRLVGFPEPIRLEDFTGIVLHSDMETTGEFTCSDPLVNQLQHNIRWGLKGNFLDVPTDCPQRDERLGWTGDAQVFARTSAYLSNVVPFFRKWLHDLKVEQAELDGGVPFVVPNILSEKAQSASAWGDAAVIIPWTLYLCYGDKRVLEEQYDSMKAWVEFIRRQGDNEYLWNSGFHFGDWLALDSRPDSYIGATARDFVATAYYAYSVSLVQKAAAVLGRSEEAGRYADLHTGILDAFTQEFVTPTGRLSVPTQTGQVLSLMFGLVEGEAKERAVHKLLELLEEEKFHLTTGFVGTPYLNHVLSDNGKSEFAYKLLLQQDYPSWLYQVTKGATTIWEHWDGIKPDGSFWSPDMNSFNHYAYGAIGDWLYRVVAGIDTDERNPGYKRVVIRPMPGDGLTWAEGRIDTMYGEVSCRWTKSDGERLDIQVVIPPNTTAEIRLPYAPADGVTESGTALMQTTGICNVEVTDMGVSLEAGSGQYSFSYMLTQPVPPLPKVKPFVFG